ncbi:permease C29B12.14c [Colletotrichum plurivorum]|uniref:Permease C29B12.14c n=1 Tax=Colletotrichum plurivorum TaxID=2175906 RepID=A0A8H6JBJ9_9PEZI|nr:permease C29B12.14c [Colletotrichum plurivorum]
MGACAPKPFAACLEVKQPEGSPPVSFLVNNDLRPLPRIHRTWGWIVWLTFWLSASSSVTSWQSVAAGVAEGLTAWESLLALFGGRVVGEVFIIANGRPGAVYHIPMPALLRTSWGVYGAWWPILNRTAMTIIFMGIGVVQGGFCVYVMLHAVIPGIANLPPKIQSQEGITTGQFVGIMVFSVLMLATDCVPVPKLKWAIFTKVIVFFASALAMVGWFVTLAGGIGHMWDASSDVRGSERRWLIVRFFFLNISNQATFMMNAADWQRFSRTPSHSIVPQLVGGMLAHSLVPLIGGFVASAGASIFGEPRWNPVLLLDQILSENYTPGTRAACFFLGAAFTYSTLIGVVLQNALPAGYDLAGLFPKYVNYQRGTLICGLLCMAICPWRLLKSAGVFVSFLENFPIFLSAFIGIICSHYYLLDRGHIDIEDLFIASKEGSYYYWHGVNLRAVAAYVAGTGACAYGFTSAIGIPASLETTRSYYFSFFIGFFSAALVYTVVANFFPVTHQVPMRKKAWHEPKDYSAPEDIEMHSISTKLTVDEKDRTKACTTT